MLDHIALFRDNWAYTPILPFAVTPFLFAQNNKSFTYDEVEFLVSDAGVPNLGYIYLSEGVHLLYRWN